MSSDVAMRAINLSKAYRTYQQPADRLKQALRSKLNRGLNRAFGHLGRRWAEPRYYTEHWALEPFSLEIRRGETVGIIGKNGSGKSTLLSLLCGTTAPTSGQAILKGRVGALLELGSGFNPEFSGRENVFLNASILGLSTAATENKIEDIASFADIGEYFDRPIKTYSSGMTMRLAFSVIAHVDCDILVVDEALAVGDAYFQQKCLRWLRQFQKSGTVLFVSHDIGSVLSLCSRAVWLDNGRTQMIGASKEVCEAYNAFIHKMSTGQTAQPYKPAEVEELATELATPGPSVETISATSDVPCIAPSQRRALPEPLPLQSAVFDTLTTSDSFGTGLAKIVSGKLLSADGAELPILKGGERLQLTIKVEARESLDSVIVGYIIKDRLGQPIFGDNTLECAPGQTLHLDENEGLNISFKFQLPLLAAGRYAITLAIATGSLAEHVQHHWLYDALMFDVRSSVGGVMFALPPAQKSVSIKTDAASPK